MKRIGIYGGTFDPIHNGHLRVVVELISRKVVDEIILVPAGEPKLRLSPPIADGKTRLEMCNLAIKDLPPTVSAKVKVSNCEVTRTGPSYAIDTVAELSSGDNEYFWIIGSDAYEKIDDWHRSAELKEKVSFIVIDRPGGVASDEDDVQNSLDIAALDISATQIRSDRELNGVSPSVKKYIRERKLYASK